MIARDPLAAVEAAAIAEEVTSLARHALRNELAVVRGAAYFVRRRVSETELWATEPRLQQFLAAIEERIDRATSLTDRDAVGARLHARRPAPVEMLECVRAAIRAARVDGAVQLRAAGSRALVKMDPAEGALAVRCLLENAAEAMPGGGVVEVVISEVSPTGELTVEVADAGGGFTPEAMERALEPGFTTKEGRMGLGLPIARRICNRYGGSLAIRAAGSGAVVALSLPSVAAPAEAGGGGAGSRLLLVDDNDGVRLAMSAVLEDEGFLVDTASSFAEASGRIAPGAPSYAIVLLDRHLGDRLGTDLVPLLRAVHPSTKVVLLSGTSGEHAEEADVDAAFDKAGDLDELIMALRKLSAGAG